MADLSLVMLNHVLEAALAFMILLLAMSVAVIARVGPAPATATTTESNTGSEAMAPPPGRVMTAMPALVRARWELSLALAPGEADPGLFHKVPAPLGG